MERALPCVSVIMPIRNEADVIREVLAAVLTQTVEPSEIIVADGMSDDGTRDILDEIAGKSGTPTVLDNADRTVQHGLNRALSEASGDVLVRVDGHAYLPADYIERCLAMLQDHPEAWVVGGTYLAAGATLAGEAAAHAFHSPFGVGGGVGTLTGESGPVDGVPLGVFRRKVFDRVGGFDPELALSEDDEMSQRIRDAGGVIWCDPSLRVIYITRSTWWELLTKHVRWGMYKVKAARKRPSLLRARHAVPAAFVLALAASGAMVPWLGPAPLVLVGGAWVVAASLAAMRVRPRRIPWPAIVPAFWVMHVGYGVGLLAGLIRR